VKSSTFLVVQLPSAYTGGDVTLYSGEQCIPMAMDPPSGMRYLLR